MDVNSYLKIRHDLATKVPNQIKKWLSVNVIRKLLLQISALILFALI